MIPRLYHEGRLATGTAAALTQAQAHYLRNVLRREEGAEISLFNARDGEFAARLGEIGKKSALAAIEALTRRPEAEPDIELLISPVKRAAMELIVQKGTELGASAFVPVLTDRTNAERLRTDRLQAIALEAAEQCGRLSVPPVREPVRLAETLLHWDQRRILIFCDEAGDDPSKEWGGRQGRAAPLLEAVAARAASPASIVIGPEGGFTPEERAWLRALPFVAPVTLGPRILRADTAAIVSLALWQAACGDLARR
ncbi:MAG: 16S rRNA (uracil(1498)-N(3))-methyltransferase [Pseudomonadota bacterium]